MSKLILAPTPIGNLNDITFRVIEVLKSADLILAEDTRVSKKLMQHFDIQTPMVSHHAHNEHQSINKWVERIKAGETIVLISDSGTPAISDPGFLLTRACANEGIAVECLPGPTAFIPALVNSGLPADRFCFEGFLPHKKGRQSKLEMLAQEERTLVFYESPYRIKKLLEQAIPFFGEERQGSISREISKKFEETIRGNLKELLEHFTKHEPRGEFVVVIAGKNYQHKHHESHTS